MADYHFIYKNTDGATTQWDEIQRKLGNLPPNPPPSSPPLSPPPTTASSKPTDCCPHRLHALKSGGAKFDTTEKPSNVLITAASGGVGHYAVQLTKLVNLHVTATCGARTINFVKNLVTDEVLNYKTPKGDSLKSPSGRTYDSVIHYTTGISWSTFEPNLSANGKMIDITPSPSTIFSYVVIKEATGFAANGN